MPNKNNDSLHMFSVQAFIALQFDKSQIIKHIIRLTVNP